MRQREKETTKRKNRRAMMALSEKERERETADAAPVVHSDMHSRLQTQKCLFMSSKFVGRAIYERDERERVRKGQRRREKGRD